MRKDDVFEMKGEMDRGEKTEITREKCTCVCMHACRSVRGVCVCVCVWVGMETGSWCGLCVKHQEHHIDP